MYYHGEPIHVNVQITNNSNKTVKKIRMTGNVKFKFYKKYPLPKKYITNTHFFLSLSILF